jgi:hypothetical protein
MSMSRPEARYQLHIGSQHEASGLGIHLQRKKRLSLAKIG